MPPEGEPVGIEGLPLGKPATPIPTGPPPPDTATALDDPATASLLRRYRRRARWFALIGFALFVAFVFVASWLQSRADKLYETGVEVEGVVVQDGSENLLVEYPVDGRPHRDVLRLTDSSRDYVVGEPLVVVYDPANPSRFVTDEEDNDPPWTVAVVVGALIGGLVFVVLAPVMMRRGRRYRKRLAAHPWGEVVYEYVIRGRTTPVLVLSTPDGRYLGVYGLSSIMVRTGLRLQKNSGGRIWAAGDPDKALVVALPGPERLFQVRPPRSARTRRRWEAELGISEPDPGT